MSDNNLYKVRGLNGTCYVFAIDMSHAVESYRDAERVEYDEWVEEQGRGLAPEEVVAGEEEVGLEPYLVELVCTSNEIIGLPE